MIERPADAVIPKDAADESPARAVMLENAAEGNPAAPVSLVVPPADLGRDVSHALELPAIAAGAAPPEPSVPLTQGRKQGFSALAVAVIQPVQDFTLAIVQPFQEFIERVLAVFPH